MTKERRQSTRIPIQMWVEEVGENSLYFQRAVNLSSTGLFLGKTVPHIPGTRVKLKFTLPGEKDPIQLEGEIVRGEDYGDRMGMGVHFLTIPKDVQQKLERFVKLRDGK